MDYYAGIDVSLKESSVCIVDAKGKIVREVKVASEPETLDLSASFSLDNAVILVNAIYEPMLEKLKAKGGLVLDDIQKAKLEKAIWVDGHINAKVVAQTPQFIADYAGFTIPADTQFFIVPATGAGPDHPFSGEKMTVTMALYRAKDLDEAITLTNTIQAYQGQGHSCGIYSTSDANIMKLANATRTSRVMVNQPQSASNSSNLWNGMRHGHRLGGGARIALPCGGQGHRERARQVAFLGDGQAAGYRDFPLRPAKS